MVSRAQQFMFFLFLSQFLYHASSSQCSDIHKKIYPNCLPLAVLNATLQYSYNDENSILSVVFMATPPSNTGWIAWGVNPNGEGMLGTQAIVTFKKDSLMVIKTFNLISYSNIFPSKLTIDIQDLKAEEEVGGRFMIYATMRIPGGATSVNHTWQSGHNVTEDGMIVKHPSDEPHWNSKGKIPLVGDCPATTRGRIFHEGMNIFAWGILNPIGLVAIRHKKSFPFLFHVHLYSHLLASFIGVGGGIVGILNGIKSDVTKISNHGIIGIILMCLAVIQVVVYYLIRNMEYEYRSGSFLKRYHYFAGYLILTLGIGNIYNGFAKHPQAIFKTAYNTFLVLFCAFTLGLELFPCFKNWMGPTENNRYYRFARAIKLIRRR